AECPGRVPGVPALVRFHHVEEGSAATADRLPRHSRDSEGRSIATGRERRHALVSLALSPDPDTVSAGGDVSFQPRMMDDSLGAQPFHDCSNPGDTGLRRGWSSPVWKIEHSVECSRFVEDLT